MLRSSVLTDPTVWALLLAQYVIHSLVSPFNNLRNSAELSDDCPFSRGLFLASPFPLTHSYETFWNLTTLFPCQQKKQSAAEAEYKKWEGKWRNESGRWKSKAEWRGYILYMSLVWIQCWIPPRPHSQNVRDRAYPIQIHLHMHTPRTDNWRIHLLKMNTERQSDPDSTPTIKQVSRFQGLQNTVTESAGVPGALWSFAWNSRLHLSIMLTSWCLAAVYNIYYRYYR